eukprot:jgi/Galph1/241/GphlegSOOS_G4928.1
MQHSSEKESPTIEGTFERTEKEAYDAYWEVSDSNTYPVKPAGAVSLAWFHFRKEWSGLVETIYKTVGLVRRDNTHPPDCFGFCLDNEKVLERQQRRESQAEGKISTSPLSRLVYDTLCSFIDWAFQDRPIQRFWFLETVARMPYFSYVSVLHLYETLGWWRNGELLKIHFAEEYNEYHHLLIMECLGGDRRWLDRFFAQHAAVFYYWLLVFYYFLSPSLAYNFSELVEAHAVDTYSEFLDANANILQELPPPKVAEQYYLADNLYMYDEFQNELPGTRRPPCNNLYEVFQNIRDDEMEHVKTMHACQEYARLGKVVHSPHESKNVSSKEKRTHWKEWAKRYDNKQQS